MHSTEKQSPTTQRIELIQEPISRLKELVQSVIVGQDLLLDKILVGLFSGGHLLLEGMPGLAKTLSLKTLAQALGLDFQRVQFTPDLLPSDLIGTQVYHPKNHDFEIKKGPLFANFLLADEINRAPAKVQSALLEAMAEKQVTIANETFALPSIFLVMATQNPIDQEGTYTLPEAQMDRFMLKLLVDYPSREEEAEILDRMTKRELPQIQESLDIAFLHESIAVQSEIHIDEKIKSYILDIVGATRDPSKYGCSDLSHLIEQGASPRASLALVKASRVVAMMKNRDFVLPDDVKYIVTDVLRHRIIASYEAQAEGLDTDALISSLISQLKVP